jgi:hypothetical protein
VSEEACAAEPERPPDGDVDSQLEPPLEVDEVAVQFILPCPLFNTPKLRDWDPVEPATA